MSFQAQNQKTLTYLSSFVPILAFDSQDTSLVISVKPQDLLFTLEILKKHTNTQYTCLSSVSGVDYPERSRRFEVSYDLLSIKFNSRIRVKTFVDELTPLESCVSVFSGGYLVGA
jgi:NADH dehydrogenase (ubiquinone) Fe-S protein 3